MAVKIYSDVTKKFYDNEESALAAEKELTKARDEKAARRKQMAQEVEEKREAYVQARNEYRAALNKFCKEYGSYHYTLNNKDLEDIFNDIFGW